MQVAAIVIIAFLVLTFLICACPLRLVIHFSHISEETSFSLFGGLGFFKMNLTTLLSKKKKKKTPEDNKNEEKKRKKDFSFRDLEKMIQKGISLLQYLKKKLTVKLFALNARFALGDAADTGIGTGVAYSSIFNLLGLIDHYFILKKQEVVITPVFQGIGFEADFKCEIQLRLIYVIGLILKIRKEDVK